MKKKILLKSIIALPAITVVTIPVASCAAVNVKTVSKIEITKQPEKHDYFVGDKLDLSGVKVSATYSDSTLEDVTNDCTFSKENNSVLSEEDRTIIVTHKPSNMKCELNIRIGQGVHVSSVEIDSIITQQVKPGSEYNYTFIGEPKKLGVTVKPEGATNPKVKWEIADPKIATVDQEGMVTPISEGLTTIKAISEDNPNKTHEIAFIVVEHEIKAQSIKIQNKPSSYLPTGSAHDISAKFLPEDTSIQNVVWESSNTNVATIDVDQTYEQTTKIHAISPGITTITAKNYDGEVQDSFELTVQDVKIKNISFDQEAYLINTFNKEKTQDIRVTIQPETATNKKLKWETSDSEVATVEATDSGATVTQKKEGVVTIKATAQDGTGVSSSVEVYIGSYNKLESIEFAEETIVFEDQSIDLPKITYNPTEPTIKDVDWKISDTSYAEINGDKIIGKKAGEVTITATPLDPGYTKGPISHKLIVKVDPSKIKEIKLDKFYTLNLKIKQKLKVEPEVLPTTATEGYKIVSEDTTKVKIDDNGFLEPLRTGTTQIQVISNSGKASSMWTPVYVSNSILTEEIKIKQNPIYIDRTKTSESIKAEAQIIPLGASETLHWYSNNPEIVEIDKYDGTITGKKAGEAKIQAWSTDGSEKKSNVVKVIVCDSITNVTDVTLSQSTLELTPKSESVKLVPTIQPAEATSKNIIWSEDSEEKVIKLDQNGNVTPVGVGTAIVTATSDLNQDKKATCTVTVKPIPIKEIIIAPTALHFVEGDKPIQLDVQIKPSEASIRSLNWTTSDTSAAVVNDEGLVTPRYRGQATITATAKDGSGVSATCTVTVDRKIIPVETLTFDKESIHFTLGKENETTLKATVGPVDCSNHNVKWSIENENVASINYDSQEPNIVTIKPKNIGSTSLTATTHGCDAHGKQLQKTITILVESTTPWVTDIKITDTYRTVMVGNSTTVELAIKPESATNKKVKYSTENKGILEINDAGVIKGLVPGSEKITVVALGSEPGKPEVKCEAVYKVIPKTHILTLRAGENGTIYNGLYNIEHGTTFKDAIDRSKPEIIPNTGYKFSHWVDEKNKPIDDNFKITEPFTAIAIFEEEKFGTDSWANVIKYANQGLAKLKEVYGVNTFVGLERYIDIDGERHIVRVIGEEHDTITGTNQKAALTFELVTLLTDKNGKLIHSIWDTGNNYNYTHGNLRANLVGGYPRKQDLIDSQGNKTCVYNMLTDELRSGIKKVNKTVWEWNSKGKDGHFFDYSDFLFALSATEMGFDSQKSQFHTEGTTYKYWKEHNTDRERKKSSTRGESNSYWLTSPRTDTMDRAWCMIAGGVYSDKIDCSINAISFAFCI